MSKKNNDTQRAESPKVSHDDLPPELAGFVEEQISFPPYWTPEEGKSFYGMVVDVDTNDPQFTRYVVQAYMPTPCERGDKHNKEDVTVQKGEFFTLSAYAGLPLDRYVGFAVFVTATGRREIGQPQPMWEFTLKISPEDRKVLVEDRKAKIAIAMQKYRENRKLGLTPRAAALPPAPFENA